MIQIETAKCVCRCNVVPLFAVSLPVVSVTLGQVLPERINWEIPEISDVYLLLWAPFRAA